MSKMLKLRNWFQDICIRLSRISKAVLLEHLGVLRTQKNYGFSGETQLCVHVKSLERKSDVLDVLFSSALFSNLKVKRISL